MSDRLWNVVLMLMLLAVSSLGGCASFTRVDSSGVEAWSPADSRMAPVGVSLVLPSGAWHAHEIAPGYAIEFQQPKGAGRILLMRISSEEIPSRQIALSRLFSHFSEKQEISRQDRVLPGGQDAAFVEYALVVKGKPVYVRACVVRGDKWVHELITWGLDSITANAIADSMVFTETP